MPCQNEDEAPGITRFKSLTESRTSSLGSSSTKAATHPAGEAGFVHGNIRTVPQCILHEGGTVAFGSNVFRSAGINFRQS